MLSMHMDTQPTNWDDILPFVMFAYNTSLHDTTTFSLLYHLYARDCKTLLDTFLPYADSPCSEYVSEAIARAEESSQDAQDVHTLCAAASYDEKHKVTLSPGDQAWVWSPDLKVGLWEKLLCQYYGPGKVVHQTSPLNYMIRLVMPSSSQCGNVEDIVHATRIKPYHAPVTSP